MATAMIGPSKTDFVKEFLSAHPGANTRAVNEAWTAAGYKGTIGDSLIYHLKSEMRKGANRRGSTQAAAAPGKAGRTGEFLNNQPESAGRKVNGVSKAAGMKRPISPASNSKAKASPERAGAPGGNSAATTTGTESRALPRHATAAVAATRGENADRTSALLNIEAEIDQLLYTVMKIGDLADIETSLRSARRKLYGAMNS